MAGRRVPNPNHIVGGQRVNRTAVRAVADEFDVTAVATQGVDRLSRRRVPYANSAVPTRAREVLPVGAIREVIDDARVTFIRRLRPPGSRVPKSNREVEAGGSECPPVRREGDRVYRALVAAEGAHLRAAEPVQAIPLPIAQLLG